MREAARRGLVAGVALAVLWHAGVGVWSGVRFARRLPPTWLERPEVPPSPVRAAVRVLPRLAARIPEGARVLLLTSDLERVQHEFHFVPRPFDRLLDLPADTVALAAGVDPLYGWYGEWLRARLAERGQLWSAGQYATSVAQADYVVVFFFGPPVPAVPRLEPVAELEGVRLLRVVR